MNGKATTDKTTVSSEADLTSDEETSITKTTNQYLIFWDRTIV